MGKFKPGQSGNPGGRPKTADEFKAKARAAADEHVIQAWIDEVLSRGKDWLRASENLAAYGHGKPVQPTDNKHSGPDGEALGVQVTFVKAGR